MKITAITCKMIHVPYKGHYQTAAGQTKHVRRVLVSVETDEGIIESPIVMNEDATVDLPEGPSLGIAVSDAKVEQYRAPDTAL